MYVFSCDRLERQREAMLCVQWVAVVATQCRLWPLERLHISSFPDVAFLQSCRRQRIFATVGSYCVSSWIGSVHLGPKGWAGAFFKHFHIAWLVVHASTTYSNPVMHTVPGGVCGSRILLGSPSYPRSSRRSWGINSDRRVRKMPNWSDLKGETMHLLVPKL